MVMPAHVRWFLRRRQGRHSGGFRVIVLTVQGHFWTIVPHFVRGRAEPAVPGRRFGMQGRDLGWGPVPITGKLFEHPHASRCAIVVHGLGGSADSVYGREMTALLLNRGWSVLRLNLRGADEEGRDLYHAALTADLEDALTSPAVAHYAQVAIIGFSLGGHITLRWAQNPSDPRVVGVCAISAPIDLKDCAKSLDSARFNVYRRHVLRGLKAQYARIAKAREAADLPSPPAQVDKVDSIQAWDRLVVVPRFGFGRVQDYYASASAGPRLGQLRVPALYLGSRADPMVPSPRCESFLERAGDRVDARWVDGGGHVAFPRHINFGLGPKPGLEAQTEAWLDDRCRA